MALPNAILTEAEVLAVRAMIAGTASPDQQRTGMTAIGNKMCGIFNSPYVADGADRETFIAIGRHQVGTMIAHTRTNEALEAAQLTDQALARRGAPTSTRGKP